MNLKEQIEGLLSQDDSSNILKEILEELKKINKKLDTKSNKYDDNNNRKYYKFINRLRKELKPIPEDNIYPEILYKGRKIGVTKKGYLYDKSTNSNLKVSKAYEIYEFLYKNRDNLNEYITAVSDLR